MSNDPADAPRWTPSPWMNKVMSLMLRTPGLQRWAGRSTALITVIGRNTGAEITFPISYVDAGGHLVATGHHTRQWWRNLVVNPQVQIRIAGENRHGVASVTEDPDDALDDFLAYIEAQPVVAKMSEIAIDADGHADRERAKAVLAYTVVVSIKVEEE